MFPEFIESYKRFGIIQRAIKKNLIKLEAINLRDFGLDARGTVDDRPYGGGVGMVLRPDVSYKAIEFWKQKVESKRGKAVGEAVFAGQRRRRPTPSAKRRPGKARIILLTPQGKPFAQSDARRLLKYQNILLISGRYEGFDERIRAFVDEEISVGDYVLMGGELPALAVTEAVIRLIPGVLGKLESADRESFAPWPKMLLGSARRLLEYPQYTKPEIFTLPLAALKDENQKKRQTKGKMKIMRVPKILLTGHHENIEKWRIAEAIKRTKKRRPDIISQNPPG